MEKSQLEFWTDFDEVQPAFSVTKHKKPVKKPENEEILSLKKKIKLINSINQAERLEIWNTERKATIELVQSAVNELKDTFQVQLKEAREKNEIMVKEIDSQESYFSIISSYINDTEILITQNRLKKPPAPQLINLEKYQAFKEELNKDLSMTKLKIESLKEGIKKYAIQTDNTNKKANDMLEYLSSCKVKYEKELKEFQENCIFRLKKGKEENLQLKKDFESYKKEKNSELETIEKKCDLNSEVIQALQNEIKAVKEILNYPVLKLRVHENLQGYLNDYKIATKTIDRSQVLSKIKRLSITQDFSIDPNLAKSIDDGFSPMVSKLNLSSRKTSSTGTRTKPVLMYNN